MMPPDVKFPRNITLGISGKDVLAHKRAVARAAPDLYPWQNFTPYAGEVFIRAAIKLKKRWGMNSQPLIGKAAHERLERTHSKTHPDEWAFDARAIALAHEYWVAWNAEQAQPEDAIRRAIKDAAFFWYAHRAQIAYSNARPFQQGKPPWVPSRWDCSAFFTVCHFAGGAPDPNGRGYDHEGYTGTLIDQGTRVSGVSLLEPGDGVFFGHSAAKPGFNYGDPTHVALYVGGGMVLSMGHYPMGYYRWNYRPDLNHFRKYKVA